MNRFTLGASAAVVVRLGRIHTSLQFGTRENALGGRDLSRRSCGWFGTRGRGGCDSSERWERYLRDGRGIKSYFGRILQITR